MSKLEYTSLDEIPKIHELLRAGFKSGKTRPVAYRKHQLLQLAYLLKDNRQRFRDAFSADFKRPYEESDMLEIDPSIGCVVEAYDSVAKWAARERAPFDQLWFAMSPAIRKEPRGTVLVVAPFNYPVLLLVNGFVGAIAAGCTVLLKPSELVPSISGLLAELLPQYLDQDLYRIVNGAVPEMTKILELKWDHIFYTGGGRVAQIISIAAAKHLTPLTLELGGKSPVVIDPGCDLNVAARRILWGKTINAGQVCLAPDYALVPKDFQDTFVAAMQRAFNEFFPTESPRPGVMSCIVSQQHASRLKRLVDETKGTIVFGGQVDVEQQFISPTVVKDVAGDDVLMSEEIFGPILPVVPVKDVDEAIEFINARDSPLALYVFSRDSAFKAKVFDNTQSGMAVANEVVIGMAVHGVPFGGTGASGHGYSTGKWSFDAFTHLRATFDNPSWVDTLIFNRRYPPYSVCLVA
ncbi:uncharacterized protein FIBRA_06382 [Fibroporia radiculosa]|uniref:Aldehyde dehydrogenase n=1 Tax=Fibroporia radiculosa TaxID=599839 RepID=J4GSM8_9APHY|nr:uncharacterized protein FIBRA_06382 [Fibroporia radiculosa]CCM04215.1 predicted protein [Fibroporia radiculosa]